MKKLIILCVGFVSLTPMLGGCSEDVPEYNAHTVKDDDVAIEGITQENPGGRTTDIPNGDLSDQRNSDLAISGCEQYWHQYQETLEEMPSLREMIEGNRPTADEPAKYFSVGPMTMQFDRNGLLEDIPGEKPGDPWGSEFRIEVTANHICASSAGPDRRFGTQDDLRWPTADENAR